MMFSKRAGFFLTIKICCLLGMACVFSNAFAEAPDRPSAIDFLHPGEVLLYDVYWSGIPCGEIKMEILDMIEYEGKEAFHFVLTAESNRFLSVFYEVRDRIESIADAKELYSLRYEKRLREGHYEKDQVVTYNPEMGTAKYVEKSGEEEIQVMEKSKDTLSSFYLFRTVDLEIGTRVDFYVDSNKKHYKLRVHAKEKEEIEIRNRGVFDTIRVEVDVEKIVPDGDNEITKNGIVLWMSNDEKRVPVRIRTQVFLGEIDMLLKPGALDQKTISTSPSKKSTKNRSRI